MLTPPLLLLSAALQLNAAGASLGTLLDEIEKVRVERDIPAVTLTITDAQRTLWSGALGIADRASARAADDRTVFRIGSVTKLFTALALLIADDENALDIDAPIVESLTDFPMSNPYEQDYPLQVSHLLEHTAGLPDLSRAEFDYNQPMPLATALNWKRADRTAQWPPGMHHSYSNVGAGLAAWVLERASGRRYEDFVEERIFTPLGMKSASFYPDPPTLAALATGYDTDGQSPIPYWHMTYRAFGAINVRPAEMAPFIRLLLNHGRHVGRPLIDAGAIDRMETPATTLAAHAGLRYGYGLGNYTWLHRGVLFHGHGGDADGYLSKLGYSHERGLGYFLVINVYRQRDLRALQRLIEDFVAGPERPATPLRLALSPVDMQGYAGTYRAATQRFPGPSAQDDLPRILIESDGAQLFIRRSGKRRELIPVAASQFRYRGETMATSAFVEHRGRMYFQDDNGSYLRD